MIHKAIWERNQYEERLIMLMSEYLNEPNKTYTGQEVGARIAKLIITVAAHLDVTSADKNFYKTY